MPRIQIKHLPENFFHCPPLSDKERKLLVAKAKSSARSLVESLRGTGGPIQWLPAGRYKGVQLFRGEDRATGNIPSPGGSDCDIQYVCGATRVMASLEAIAAFFDTSSTQKMRRFLKLYNEDILDSIVLYTLVEPTLEKKMHQVTVKWTAMDIPSPMLRNRDFCTLECQDEFTDSTGRRGWVRSMHSIRLPCCPDMRKELGLIRGSIYNSGYIFMESEEKKYLDVVHCVQVNLKGSLKLPRSIYFLACRRRVIVISQFSKFLQQERLNRLRLLGDLDLVPKHERSHCEICRLRFNIFFHRKFRCRACGEVVCSDCCQLFTFSSGKQSQNRFSVNEDYKVVKLRVCLACSNQSEQQITESLYSSTTTPQKNENFSGRASRHKQKYDIKQINVATTAITSRSSILPAYANDSGSKSESDVLHKDHTPEFDYQHGRKKNHWDRTRKTNAFQLDHRQRSNEARSPYSDLLRSPSTRQPLTSEVLKAHDLQARHEKISNAYISDMRQPSEELSQELHQLMLDPDLDEDFDMSLGVDSELLMFSHAGKRQQVMQNDNRKLNYCMPCTISDAAMLQISDTFGSLKAPSEVGYQNEGIASYTQNNQHYIRQSRTNVHRQNNGRKQNTIATTKVRQVREEDEMSDATVNIEHGARIESHENFAEFYKEVVSLARQKEDPEMNRASTRDRKNQIDADLSRLVSQMQAFTNMSVLEV